MKRSLPLSICLLLPSSILSFSLHELPSLHILQDHLSCFDHVLHQLDVQRYAVEGAIAGGCRALARGATFPFDTWKTLEQVDGAADLIIPPPLPSSSSSSSYSSGSGSSSSSAISPKLDFNALFSGVTPAVLSAIPANAAFFVVYKSLEVLCSTYFPLSPSTSAASMKLMQRILITSIATLPQNSIKIPFEVVKQRLQTSNGASRKEIISSIYRSHGWKGFFVGGNAQLLRELPYNAIQMCAFEYLKESYHIAAMSDASFSALSGLFSSSLAALFTQPVDVVKTKIMAADEDVSSSVEDRNIVTIVKTTMASEGWRGFFVGLKPRIALVSVGGMVYFWAAALVEQHYEQ